MDAKVTAEITGKVTEVNKTDEYDNYGQEKPFIVIVESDNLRIKGTINEMNRGNLTEGQRVTILSRVDDNVWSGVVSMIDWSAAEKPNDGGYYYPVDEMSTSSKYPFYIDVDDPEGLIIGQHVFIELAGGESSDNAIRIPAYFINDADTDPWVWVSNSRDKLEKRNITLGEFNEDMFEYVIESGLTADDYIAFPQEGLKNGMRTTKTQEPDEFDPGMQDGEGFYPEEGGEFYPEDGAVFPEGGFDEAYEEFSEDEFPSAEYNGATVTDGEGEAEGTDA